jgi:hypothetical protein
MWGQELENSGAFSTLRPGVYAKIEPFVQLLNIIEGYFLVSSSFFKDFNKELIVVASMQIPLNNSENLRGKRLRR